MANSPWKEVVSAVNSGKRYPVMQLARDHTELAATISKLVRDRESPIYGKDGNREVLPPNYAEFKSLSEKTAQNVSDAQTVMQVLPETELAAQILISSILAPKDMMTTELTYSSPEGLLAPAVSAAMLNRTREHFEQAYKIKSKLSGILRDALFETGSYPIAVVPENSIDEAINGPSRISMEDLRDALNADGSPRALGLLGPVTRSQPSTERKRPGLAIESLAHMPMDDQWDGRVTFETQFASPVTESFLSVTDNINTLKIPQIYNRIRQERILDTVGRGSPALESINPRLNDRQMSAMVYKERQYGYKPIVTLKTQEQLARRTIGNPMILHLPSESVIPVFVPGTVEHQVGFFVLLDVDGNPVRKPDNPDYYQDLSNRLNAGGNFASAMLNKVKGQMQGFNLGNSQHLDRTARMYGDLVEADLLARLRNGVYGNGVALARQDEIYRIMLSRALAKQHTQLLFIPVELMTYFAFRFNENGIGKSILDDMKILNSLRSMLTFANVMASLKNSIGRTEVKVKLDESDPNPQKTIETAMHELLRSRQQYFPLGMNSPMDLVDWLQRSGYEITYEGHPGLPDVKIDMGEKASNYPKPDSDLEENLRKKALMAIGLSPETVDNGFHAEFATTVVAQNLLLAKRVTQMQEQFEPLLNDHLHKVAMNSQELVDELRSILEENFDHLKIEKKDEKKAEKKADQDSADGALSETEQTQARGHLVDELLREFVMSFEVSLPRPNSVTLENQLEALKKYIEALDVALEAYISEDFFTQDLAGNAATYAVAVKKIIRAHFIRQWMSENGMLTELSKITATDADGKPMINFFEMQKAHMDGLGASMVDLLKGLHKKAEANDKALEKAGIQAGSGGGGGSSYGGDTGGGDFGGGGSGDGSTGGGEGDFDLGGGSPMDGLDANGDGIPDNGDNTDETNPQPEGETGDSNKPAANAENSEQPEGEQPPAGEEAAAAKDDKDKPKDGEEQKS